MRTWTAAERAIRRETGLNIGGLRGQQPFPLVIAVGGARPDAVLALGSVDPEDPSITVAELAFVAGGFRPSRALVALAISRTARRRSGLLVCVDTTAVPDGLVEVTRARMWWRIGRLVIWLPGEIRRWQAVEDILPRIAKVILVRAHRDHSPEFLDQLLTLTRAAGHRVRLAR